MGQGLHLGNVSWALALGLPTNAYVLFAGNVLCHLIESYGQLFASIGSICSYLQLIVSICSFLNLFAWICSDSQLQYFV